MAAGPETEKCRARRIQEGFFYKYLSGLGIDVGYKGSDPNAEPVRGNLVGVDLDFPGYDGLHLPFPDESQYCVYTSHCLEHVNDYKTFIQECFRVLATGHHLVICVPHQFLYEKKATLPSNWNSDHKRMYTPALIMHEIETSLEPNTYRLIYLKDCADGFDYNLGPTIHSCGEYQLEAVIQKIKKPTWELK